MATENLSVQEFKLEQDQELRFEIENKDKAYLKLKTGNAEIFGTEIVKGKVYEFAFGAKVAVFTWQGCILELRGKTDVSYVAKDTPMVTYANCHAALEQMRIAAEMGGKRGPVAIVTGPSDVGKSTVCRILLNYAVRMGRRPLFVDLDLGQGQIGIPGTVGALLVERPAAPTSEDGFSQEAPLVYHVGHKSPEGNIALYNLLTTQLAHTVLDRIDSNKRTRMSGVIINTCGWVKGTGYKHLLRSITAFEVDVVLCLDQERLYNELVRDVPSFVKVVFLPKSGGVVERSKSYRREARDHRVREYFYGSAKNSLYPHSFDVKWSEMKLYKIGAPALPASCLPLGMKPQDHLTKLVPLTPNAGILHHILAVSFAEKDDDQMIKCHVAGFICVTNVDTDRQTVTILSPQPKPLPNHYLLLSDMQFMDNH